MSERTITFTPPGQIDGEPAEVARAATKQLQGLAFVFEALVEQTQAQVENAGMSAALAAGEPAEEGRLVDWWKQNHPLSAALMHDATQLGRKSSDVAQRLHRAVSENK